MSKVLKSLRQQQLSGTLPIPVVSLATNDRTPTSGTAPADMEARLRDVEATCEHLLAEARAKADAMLANAEAVVAEQQRQAKAAGYEAGLAQGRAAAAAEQTTWRANEQAKMDALVTELETAYQKRFSSLSPLLSRLAMAAVKRLLHRELELRPPDVESMVSEMLTYVLESTAVQVRVHPDDYAQARAAHPRWQGMKYGDWEVAIIPDQSLARGGCQIHANTGRIDADVSTQLSELQTALDEILLQQEESAHGAETERVD